MATAQTRRRRSDGERSRSAIVAEATRLATVEGIGGLSLARLADAVGMSKSGLFAHFGSKEELQLATIDAATEVFSTQVLAAGEGAGAGLDRVRALADAYLGYVERDTFPGGCFFAAALTEMSMHPGPVRDRLAAFFADWMARLETAVTEAQADGAIAKGEDAGQLAFELEAALFLANAQYVVTRTPAPIARARRMIEHRLAQAAA